MESQRVGHDRVSEQQQRFIYQVAKCIILSKVTYLK